MKKKENFKESSKTKLFFGGKVQRVTGVTVLLWAVCLRELFEHPLWTPAQIWSPRLEFITDNIYGAEQKTLQNTFPTKHTAMYECLLTHDRLNVANSKNRDLNSVRYLLSASSVKVTYCLFRIPKKHRNE